MVREHVGIAKHFKLPYFKKYNQLVLVSDVKKISRFVFIASAFHYSYYNLFVQFLEWGGGGLYASMAMPFY